MPQVHVITKDTPPSERNISLTYDTGSPGEGVKGPRFSDAKEALREAETKQVVVAGHPDIGQEQAKQLASLTRHSGAPVTIVTDPTKPFNSTNRDIVYAQAKVNNEPTTNMFTLSQQTEIGRERARQFQQNMNIGQEAQLRIDPTNQQYEVPQTISPTNKLLLTLENKKQITTEQQADAIFPGRKAETEFRNIKASSESRQEPGGVGSTFTRGQKAFNYIGEKTQQASQIIPAGTEYLLAGQPTEFVNIQTASRAERERSKQLRGLIANYGTYLTGYGEVRWGFDIGASAEKSMSTKQFGETALLASAPYAIRLAEPLLYGAANLVKVEKAPEMKILDFNIKTPVSEEPLLLKTPRVETSGTPSNLINIGDVRVPTGKATIKINNLANAFGFTQRTTEIPVEQKILEFKEIKSNKNVESKQLDFTNLKVNTPNKVGKVTVTSWSYENPVTGRATILGTKTSDGNKIDIFTGRAPNLEPVFARMPITSEIRISNPTETELIRKTLTSTKNVVNPKRAQEFIPVTQDLIRRTLKRESTFKKVEWDYTTKRLPPEGVKAMVNLVEESKGYLGGSFSRAQELSPFYTVKGQLYKLDKIPGDIDFHLNLPGESESFFIAKGKGTPTRLDQKELLSLSKSKTLIAPKVKVPDMFSIEGVRDIAYERLKGLGYDVRIKSEGGKISNALEVKQPDGKYEKAVEFLGDGTLPSEENMPDMVVGFNKEGEKDSLQGVSKTKLNEELRGVIQGTARFKRTEVGFDIFPPTKREKDIGAVLISGKTLSASGKFDEKLEASTDRFVDLYPKELVLSSVKAYEVEPTKVILADFSKTKSVVSKGENLVKANLIGSVGLSVRRGVSNGVPRVESPRFVSVSNRRSSSVSPSVSASVSLSPSKSVFRSQSVSPSPSMSPSPRISPSTSPSNSPSLSSKSSPSMKPSPSMSPSPRISPSTSPSNSPSPSRSPLRNPSSSPSKSPLSPIPNSSSISSSKSNNKSNSKGSGFQAFIKRKNKFVAISPVVSSKLSALDIGTDIAKSTLAATFKVEKVTGVTPVDIRTSGSFQRFGSEFRDYAIRGQNKIMLQDTYIQRRGFRLGTRAEVKSIQQAKANKKSLWR